MGEEEKKPKPRVEFKFPPAETGLGIISGIIAVLIVIFPGLPAVIKAVGMVFALVWGADSVRKTSKYGLGTGVPSIGYFAAFGYGVVGAFTGMGFCKYGHLGPVEAGVLIGVVFMAITGYISGALANTPRLIAMKIPGLERGMMELGMAGTLAVLLESSILAGTTSWGSVSELVINTGLIAFILILSGMAMFHPYNACLGPDERRERTLGISVEISGLISIILGIASLVTLGEMATGISLIIFGAIVWLIFYVSFVRAAMKGAYSVVGTGLIKTIT
jgi:tetrahydromethanopterin S-methyltransferase subunit C